MNTLIVGRAMTGLGAFVLSGQDGGRSVIEIVEYDETWEVRAALARVELMPLGVFDAVEHIGSTSVPGLAAKPIIDLRPRVSGPAKG